MAKLQNGFMFSALEGKEIDIVIGAMEEKAFKPGDVVIKQGDEGDNLYVVDSGALNCYKLFVRKQITVYSAWSKRAKILEGISTWGILWRTSASL